MPKPDVSAISVTASGDQESSAADGSTAPAAAAELPAIADGVEHSLDPRVIAVDRVVGWIVTGVTSFFLLVALALVLILAPLPGWLSIALVLLSVAAVLGLGWFSYRWPEVEHRHASYKVDGQGIEIRMGVVWRKVISVPRSRVQHTDVSQGPLERSHGLGTLAIYTAGTDYAKVDLHGLDHATALRIRDHLLLRESGDAV